jgi:hypothetical protein
MDDTRSPSPPPAPDSVEERALVERFVAAFTSLDVDSLVALMTDDAWVRMPPLPFEYRGTAAVHAFFVATAPHRHGIAKLVPVRANGQPAWGEYRRDSTTGGLHLMGIEVVGLAGDLICEITRFETTVASHFGLPRTL